MIENHFSSDLRTKSYLSDEHIVKIAENEVCCFINKNNEIMHGFLLANIKPNESIVAYLPFDLSPNDVIAPKCSNTSRKLIQVVYYDASEDIDAEFHLVSSKLVNTVMRYEPETLIKDTQQILSDFKVLNPLYTSTEPGEIMYYKPSTKNFYIDPLKVYRHLTRALVISDIRPENTLLVVVSHEIGHSLDSELASKTEEYINLVKSIQILYKKLVNNKLSNQELKKLKKEFKMFQLMYLQFETNAWNIGLKFIPLHLRAYYLGHGERMLRQNRATMNSKMEIIHLYSNLLNY